MRYSLEQLRDAYRRVFLDVAGELTEPAQVVLTRLREIAALDVSVLPRPPVAVDRHDAPILGPVDPLMLAANEGGRSVALRFLGEVLQSREQVPHDDRTERDPFA